MAPSYSISCTQAFSCFMVNDSIKPLVRDRGKYVLNNRRLNRNNVTENFVDRFTRVTGKNAKAVNKVMSGRKYRAAYG